MALREEVFSAQQDALKKGEQTKLSVLRFLWSAIRNEEIDKKKDLSDSEIQQVVARQIKQLKDALQDFTAAGRQDLIDKNKMEISLLEQYLPAQLSDDELKKIVEQTIGQMGAVTASDSGKIIGAVMKQVAGKAEGGRVKEMVNKKISNSPNS